MTAIALFLWACNRPPPAPAPEDPMAPFEATLRVDPAPGPKHFQGVWLDRAGAEPLLVDYRASSCWTPFDGRKVVVTGERWTPEPQAQQVDAPHFRVGTLALAGGPSADALLVSVGAEREIAGLAETLAGEPGTKEEGSTYAAFTGEGTTWRIWGAPDDLPPDTPIVVTAREVEISPFATHAPGPTLWIASFEHAE